MPSAAGLTIPLSVREGCHTCLPFCPDCPLSLSGPCSHLIESMPPVAGRLCVMCCCGACWPVSCGSLVYVLQAVNRLATHAKNVDAVLDSYKDIMVKVRGCVVSPQQCGLPSFPITDPLPTPFLCLTWPGPSRTRFQHPFRRSYPFSSVIPTSHHSSVHGHALICPRQPDVNPMPETFGLCVLPDAAHH